MHFLKTFQDNLANKIHFIRSVVTIALWENVVVNLPAATFCKQQRDKSKDNLFLVIQAEGIARRCAFLLVN